jgi:hypothetical protein
MQLRRIISDLMLATTACAMVASGVSAQDREPPEPPAQVIQLAPMTPELEAEARQERLEELREELQEVYEELFELQVRYQASVDDAALLESLAVEREKPEPVGWGPRSRRDRADLRRS